MEASGKVNVEKTSGADSMDPAADEALRDSFQMMRVRQFDEAARLLTKAIEIRPDFARAYESRASAYLKLADYAKSIADYTAVIQLSPTRSNYEGRAEAKRASGNFDGAEEDLKRARQLPIPRR